MPQPAHEKETIAIQSNGATNDIKSLSEDLKTFGLLLFSSIKSSFLEYPLKNQIS